MADDAHTSLTLDDPAAPPRGEITISMQLGTPFDHSQELVPGLLKDADALGEQSVYIPVPGSYRRDIRRLSRDLKGEADEAPGRALLTGAPEGAGGTWVLSYPNLMGGRSRIFDDGKWFPMIGEEAAWLRALWPSDTMRFFTAIRHPAPFAADVIASDEYAGVTETAADPADLRWSDAIGALRAACPDVPVVIWRAEDVPFIWQKILGAVTGLGDGALSLQSVYDPLDAVMAPTGVERAQAYIAENAGVLDTGAVTDVLKAFHGYFAIPAEEPTGLDPAQKAALDGQYDADLEALAQMDGVEIIRA